MTNKGFFNMKENGMKKGFVVLALVAVFVFALSTAAFAWTPPIGLYIAWDTTNPANTGGPHANYTTASTKCAVCHSVHYAPAAGQVGNGYWTGTAGAKPELLLTTSVGDACSYCHIQTATGGVQIYGGDVTNIYSVWTGPGHSKGVKCTECHAVHGAGTYKGGLTSKIVKVNPYHYYTRNAQPEILAGAGATAGLFVDQAAATGLASDTTTVKYEREAVFCSSCHGMFSRSADQTITSSAGGQRMHSFVSALSGTNWSATNGGVVTQYDVNGAGTAMGVTTNDGATYAGGQIATAPSANCRSCHAAGGVNQTGISFNSFPHYSKSFPFYLPGTITGADLTANNPVAALQDPDVDGNCLACHGTLVGMTF